MVMTINPEVFVLAGGVLGCLGSLVSMRYRRGN